MREIKNIHPGKDPPSISLKKEGFLQGLRNYPDIDYAVKFIERIFGNGWKITETEIITRGNKDNYNLKREYIKEALLQIKGHLMKGSIWGPFSDEKLPHELEGGAVWPVFFRDESNEKRVKYRMLINLSDDKADVPLNGFVEEWEKSIVYNTIIDICKWILKLQLNWLFTADVKDAFHQIPIWRDQIKYVGIKMCGMLFFWTTLVFGLASSCNIWGEFAALVTWIIVNNEVEIFILGGVELLLQYADDWIGGHVVEEIAWKQYNKLKWWWDALGIPYDPDKLSPPAREVEYIGYMIYLKSYEIGITKRRKEKYILLIEEILRHYKGGKKTIKIKVGMIRKLVGQLRSVTVVHPLIIPWIRPFDRIVCKYTEKKDRFRELMIKAHHRKCLVNVREVMLNSCWDKRRMCDVIESMDNVDVVMLTDASTTKGMGGFIEREGGDYFKIMWNHLDVYERLEKKPDIIWMELAAVVTAVRIFGEILRGRTVLARCDNITSVGIVRRKTSCLKRRDLLKLVDILCDDLSHWRHDWCF